MNKLHTVCQATIVKQRLRTRPWAVNRAEANDEDVEAPALRNGRGLDHARLVFAFAQTAHDLGK